MKTYQQFMKEGYGTLFLQRVGKFGFSRFKIIHRKSGRVAGVLSIDRASGDHHFHLANGKGYTLQRGHPDIRANPRTTVDKFMKNVAAGGYDKKSERTFGPFDWKDSE